MRNLLLGAGYVAYRCAFAGRRLLALLPGAGGAGEPLPYQDFVLYYRREVMLVEAVLVALVIMSVVMFEMVANRTHDAAEATGIRPQDMPQNLTPAP